MLNKVLIVDDEIEIADVIGDFLIHDGFNTAIANTGEEALNLFKSFSPDFIMLDIMLPDNNGMELCKYFSNNSDAPIIMLSAKNSEIDKILSLGLGADDYMTKPFSPLELVARVKAHQRRCRKINTNEKSSLCNERIIELDGLKVDKKAYTVYKDDKRIELVQKEFEILLLLASNKGEVFTKEQIYDLVWGEDEFGEIGTVAVHMRRIRTKIEDEPSNPRYIKTIWGVGYRFDGE